MKKNICFLLAILFLFSNSYQFSKVEASVKCLSFSALPKPKSEEFGMVSSIKKQFEELVYTVDDTSYYSGTAILVMEKRLCAPLVIYRNFDTTKPNLTISFSIDKEVSTSTYYGETVSNNYSLTYSNSLKFKFGVSSNFVSLGIEDTPTTTISWDKIVETSMSTTTTTSYTLKQEYALTSSGETKTFRVETRGLFDVYAYYNYHYKVTKSSTGRTLYEYSYDSFDIGIGNMTDSFTEVAYYTYDSDTGKYIYDVNDSENILYNLDDDIYVI
jgi:hypothetical protein